MPLRLAAGEPGLYDGSVLKGRCKQPVMRISGSDSVKTIPTNYVQSLMGNQIENLPKTWIEMKIQYL